MKTSIVILSLLIGSAALAETRRVCEVQHGVNRYTDNTIRVTNYGYADDVSPDNCAQPQAKVAEQTAPTQAPVSESIVEKQAALSAGREINLDVKFNTGSAKVATGYTNDLKELATVLKTDKSMKVKIEGHSDSTGSAVRNLALSQLRADAIRSALIAEGVDAAQVQSVGVGGAQPVATNDTAQGRAANRRIEVQTIR